MDEDDEGGDYIIRASFRCIVVFFKIGFYDVEDKSETIWDAMRNVIPLEVRTFFFSCISEGAAGGGGGAAVNDPL